MRGESVRTLPEMSAIREATALPGSNNDEPEVDGNPRLMVCVSQDPPPVHLPPSTTEAPQLTDEQLREQEEELSKIINESETASETDKKHEELKKRQTRETVKRIRHLIDKVCAKVVCDDKNEL